MRFIITVLFVISSLYSQITGLSGWNLFVDPGHSQTENAGVYYSEAEEVLRVALHLRDLFQTYTDIDTVYLSRTNDQQQVSLSQRTNYANSLGAAWYHSIHSNAGPPDNNTTLMLWGQLYGGIPDPPIGGEEMSAYMIDILTRTMRIPTTGSWGDCSFYWWHSSPCSESWPGPWLHVNRASNMPSQLSEEGHHTNPPQNMLHLNSEYQRLLAYSYYWSVLRYHDIERPYVGICTGIVKDIETDVPVNDAIVSINGQTYTTDGFETQFSTYTDDPDEMHNGFFFFENLPDSVMELVVEAPGYYPDTLTVDILDTFFTFQDVELLSSQSPTVVSTVPENDEQNHLAWNPVRIDFSRSMNPETTVSSISIEPDVPLTFAWLNSFKILNIYPDSIMYETDIQITVSDTATDVYGHVFDGDDDGEPGGDFILNFRTSSSDVDPPYITGVYPSISASNVEQHPLINVTFNETLSDEMNIADFIRLERFSTTEIVPSYIEYYSINGKGSIHLFPTNNLFPNEVFVTRIDPGLEDGFGNATTSNFNISFQTGNTDWHITQIDNFETGLTSNWWVPTQSGSTTGTTPFGTDMVPNDTIVNHLTGSSRAMEIQYSWDEDASQWLIREYLGGGAPRNVIFNDNYIMQAYVFGDGSDNLFRFCVDDGAGFGGHEVSPWYTVNWYGWKLISWDMTNDGTGEWIGNGVLNGNLRFDSFQLSFVPGNMTAGSIIVDDLRLVQEVQLQTVENVAIPSDYVLKQNYPNPFNPETTIEFSIPEEQDVHLSIFAINGQRVRTLVESSTQPGTYTAKWDGKDQHGIQVPSGIYIYRLEGRNIHIAKRMILLK